MAREGVVAFSILHLLFSIFEFIPGSGKGKIMRWFCVLVVLLSVGGVASGQDSPQPDQLKKMYDEVLGQLRQAQDRKNELAAENDKLNARVADLQKQLDTAKLKIDEANRAAAEFAERTFFLRSYYATWQEFIHHYPKLEARWQVYLEGGVASPWPLMDKDWPLSEVK
jgi:outer membrane murein-binding lipoprotein Lpp